MKKILLLLIISLFSLYYYYEGQHKNKFYGADNIYTFTIFIDKSFNKQQETDIFNAIDAWEKASSNKIKIIPYFQTIRPGKLSDFWNKPYKDHSTFIWNISEKELSRDMKVRFNAFAGIWDTRGNILIFKEVTTGSRFYNVTLHEFGHMLKLEHFNDHYTTVMHHAATSSCITEIDAHLLCEIYDCEPKHECIAPFYLDSSAP